jgi:hypothetical protein
MPRETWLAIRDHLYEPGFAWDIEVVAMAGALEMRIAEVPVTWNDHPESTVSPTTAVPELLTALFAARHRSRRLAGNPVHQTIATHRTERPTLVSQYHERRE